MVLAVFTPVTHSFKFEPKKRYSKCFTGPADPPHFSTQFLPASHFYPFLRYFISHNQNYSVPAQHAVMSQIINKNIPHFPILPYSPTRNHVLLIPFLVEYTLLTGIYQNPIAQEQLISIKLKGFDKNKDNTVLQQSAIYADIWCLQLELNTWILNGKSP